MDPASLLGVITNGWSCLAFAIGTAAWVFDRWNSRQHQREHREATLQLADAPQALAKLPDGGTVPSGRAAGVPLIVLAVILGAGAIASATYKIAASKSGGGDARADRSPIGDFFPDLRNRSELPVYLEASR